MPDESPVRYDEDYALWAEQQAEFITARDWAAVDAKHVADEIALLSRNEQREVKRRLTVLLEHLMKIAGFSESSDRSSWESVVDEQARHIHDILDESPTLRRTVTQHFEAAFERAEKRVATAMHASPRTVRGGTTIERWKQRVQDLIAHA